jgi:hypothetical protein
LNTVKKEMKVILICKEIHMGSGAKLYMYEDGLPKKIGGNAQNI